MKSLLALTPLLFAATPALAEPDQRPAMLAPAPETSIRWVRRDGILDFEPDGKKAVYLQGSDGKWFYAQTVSNCPRLNAADRLSYETGPDGDLDKTDAIHAQGWRCQLVSVVASGPPPAIANRKRG